MKIIRFSFALAVVAAVLIAAHTTRACTGIRLQAKDGAIVYARTLEFNDNLASTPVVIPRHFHLHGTANSGKAGLNWETRYAATGMNALGQPVIIDGVNEKGLAGGIFYLPGYAKYQTAAEGEESISLGSWELVTWILTNFATVDEVRAALPGVRVTDVPFEGQVFPVHYVVHDAAGKSLVIEYLDGNLSLTDNPIGVITNAPDFGWHLTNLNNYINLTADNAAPEKVEGVTLRQLGQGSGMHGLPGDYTPPSRFVRAAALSHTAFPGDNGEDTVHQAFHVLNGFDIPRGTIRGVENGQPSFDHTQWTSASDTKNLIFYFHTDDNRRVRHVDLKECNLDAKRILVIPRHAAEDSQDLTPANTDG